MKFEEYNKGVLTLDLQEFTKYLDESEYNMLKFHFEKFAEESNSVIAVVSKAENNDLLKLVLRKFFYGDEQSIGFNELQEKIVDHLCNEIGDGEFVKFCETVNKS
jgi:hypothetical protein